MNFRQHSVDATSCNSHKLESESESSSTISQPIISSSDVWQSDANISLAMCVCCRLEVGFPKEETKGWTALAVFTALNLLELDRYWLTTLMNPRCYVTVIYTFQQAHYYILYLSFSLFFSPLQLTLFPSDFFTQQHNAEQQLHLPSRQ